MIATLRQLLRYLWNSIWFVPGLITVLCIVAAVLLSGYGGVKIFGYDVPEFEREPARSLLTSLGSASISVAAVVLSLTMLVLSSASSQFGPRLITSFMHRTGAKLAIGGFVGLFAYQMMVASVLARSDDVTDLAIWVGVAGGLGSFVILLAFLQMVLGCIQAPYLINEVTGTLDKALNNYLEQVADERGETGPELPAAKELGYKLSATKDGYIDEIGVQSLVDWAKERNVLICSRVRSGEFVSRGDVLADIDTDSDLGEKELKGLRRRFTLAPLRSPTQDVEYAIRLLVEIAAKALSPGINDFFTAITAIERLGGSLICLVDQPLPRGIWLNAEGEVRLSVPLPNAAEICDAAFTALRQNARTVEPVAEILMQVYLRLAQHEPRPDFVEALNIHAGLLLHDCRELHRNPQDIKRLAALHGEVMTALARD